MQIQAWSCGAHGSPRLVTGTRSVVKKVVRLNILHCLLKSPSWLVEPGSSPSKPNRKRHGTTTTVHRTPTVQPRAHPVGFRGPGRLGPTSRTAPRYAHRNPLPALVGSHGKSRRAGATAAGKAGARCGIREDGDSAAADQIPAVRSTVRWTRVDR